MDIGDSPEEAAFRAEARAFLEWHAEPKTPGVSNVDELNRHDPNWMFEHIERCREWQHVLYDNGWAGITWPKEFGGRGGTGIQQAIYAEEESQFDVVSGTFTIGIGMVAPTLMVHATPEQQQRYLDPMLRGDELWCQLFSEPGAGSDLATLGTRAVRDGDEWVVDGQKVWNSYAQYADWGILLTRTDPDAPKHRGITYFVVDMKTPGIDVRPLRQITGIAHFNEVFLSGVRIPAENVIGEVNGGWAVTHTTLGNERAVIGVGGGGRNADDVIALARSRGVNDDPRFRQEIVQAYIRTATLRYMGLRLRSAMSQGRQPGAEASVLKLAFSQHAARTGDLVMKILGPEATLYGDDALDQARWQDYFLNQFNVRIGGGTDEVQKNGIAERSLGLPRDPSSDRDVPWKDLARL
ncbi:MAG: acyl-CoA dehydrogenase family protein [Acidimicrobiia bacterium]